LIETFYERWVIDVREKHRVPGELLLITVLFINSMGVQFMTKSGFGISAISSVPYVFSNIFTFLSFGTWNYVFQTMLVISLMVLRKRVSAGYVISFAAGVVFGRMLDVHAVWMAVLPELFAFRVLYFAAGLLCIGAGICMANNCLMPIIPTDMFPRDFSEIMKKKYQNVKTVFDISCLLTTVALSVAFTGSVMGIGAGTVICSLLTGKVVAMFQPVFDRHFTVYRAITFKAPQRKRIAF